MRYYYPEKPLFRWFRQKQNCNPLTQPAAIDLSRKAPLTKTQTQASATPTPPAQAAPVASASAHAFLDQMAAVHRAYKWLTVAPPPKPATTPAAAKPGATAASHAKPAKPVDTFDLQDQPQVLEALGFKLSATLLRKWFGNTAYAVQSPEQKACARGAARYPVELVDANTVQHTELLKFERAKAAYERLRSQAFLESKTARESLNRILRKMPSGTVEINAENEFGADLQAMHLKYAFAAITVGRQFPENFEDIRINDLEKSGTSTDDLELALGQFTWFAAIHRARMVYNGRSTRKALVESVALYAMAPYGFDDFADTLEYKGHWNKRHLALVTDGKCLNTPVYTGRDLYARNAVLYPVFNGDHRRWRQQHQQGGDMLLFTERMYPFLDKIAVELPIEASPTGTLYWGGAGLNGPYIQPTLRALQNAGISNVYVGQTNSATAVIGGPGTLVDAFRAGLPLRYEDGGQWRLTNNMADAAGQFNLIGYSYGSLLAAQTANYYANNGHTVDHLVLIGSPIDDGFLTKLKRHPNIAQVLVINLTAEGDDIYAGMSQASFANPLFIEKLGADMLTGKGEGHFYYGHAVPGLDARLQELAKFIYSKGVR